MKNPFEKRDNTALIASVAIGSAVAGVATWLFMTEKGNAVREQIAVQLDKLTALLKRKNEGGEAAEEPAHLAYNQKKAKAPKTDRDALLHGEILSHPEAGEAS